MKIKNFNQLAINLLRRKALRLAEMALRAIDTKQVISETISLKRNILSINNLRYDLTDYQRLIVITVGKAAPQAMNSLSQILKDKLTQGLVIGLQPTKANRKIKVFIGSHPWPTLKNIKAGKTLLNFLKTTTAKDLVIFLISGGGSALLTLPPDENYLPEIGLLNSLFRAGATIQEINTIRKHTSLLRGGNLAKLAYPATVIALFMSDIPGDELQFIASGPTVKDTTTIKQAVSILNKYHLDKKLSKETFKQIKKQLRETPKESKYFKQVKNLLIVSNKKALVAMKSEAIKLGLKAKIKTNQLAGEARQIGWKIVAELKKAPRMSCFLYGGETTVNVRGKGRGGRNQELVLAALTRLTANQIILSIGTDGFDNTPAAGAVGDILTITKALKLKLDLQSFLTNNNSYNFFKKTKDHIITGPTGSNVADIIIAIKQGR